MTYDIRQHLEVLTLSTGSKTKYHCPVCNGDDLDIKPLDGRYNCFSNNCELKDIRNAIDKLEGKPEWKPAQEWKKSSRPKSQKEYFYPDRNGNQLVKVLRIDHGDGSKKDFPQSSWNGGKWIRRNPPETKKLIPIYRYAEVQQAIERQELIFWVEGESTADLLWNLGIAATTTIGGSGGYKSYGDYQEDLKGARLVLAPDRDSNGLKYIGNVAQDFPSQIESYYLAGTIGLWKKPDGGMDIGDDIRDHQLTKEQISKKVISPDEYREAIASKVKTDEQKAKIPIGNAEKPDYTVLAEGLGIPVVCDGDGKPTSKLVRLTLDLFHLVGDGLKLNLMTQDYEYEGKPLDLNHIKNFISHNLGYDSSTENCIEAVHAIADKFAYHPVKQYLESLRGTIPDFTILDNIATQFLGNSDPLANRMMAKSLIGAVARVMKPGVKVDTLTVLQGGQGFLKSTFLKVLAGESWFCDDIRDPENKDELAKLARYWLIELAEVDYLMGQKEVESFKRFLSTTADTYRPPYGRANIRHERTCALFASTNKAEFLKDPTGSRRYWIVKVGSKIDCDSVAKHRDILWATALAAYERGDTWWLDDAEEAQRESAAAEFQEVDPWQEAIEKRWDRIPLLERGNQEVVAVESVFEILEVSAERRTKAARNRIGSILRQMGFENKAIWIDGRNQKLFVRNFTSYTEKLGSLGSVEQQSLSPTGLHTEPNSKNSWVQLGSETEPTNNETLPTNGMQPEPNSEPNYFSEKTSNGKSIPKIGDRMKYIGGNKSLQAQYAGALEIFEIKGDSYTCKKPSGSLTSWIELEDLQLVEAA